MTTRSMTITAYHLAEAATSLAVVEAHVRDAQAADPDPEIADQIYGVLLNNIHLMHLYLEGRKLAGTPDLEREAKA